MDCFVDLVTTRIATQRLELLPERKKVLLLPGVFLGSLHVFHVNGWAFLVLKFFPRIKNNSESSQGVDGCVQIQGLGLSKDLAYLGLGGPGT